MSIQNNATSNFSMKQSQDKRLTIKEMWILQIEKCKYGYLTWRQQLNQVIFLSHSWTLNMKREFVK